MKTPDLPHSRPQRAPQPRLQTHDRDDVRPSGTAEHVTEGLPIHPGDQCGPADAQITPGDLLGQDPGHVLDDPAGIVGDHRPRPPFGIAGQLPRSNAASTTTGHRDAGLSFLVDYRADGRLICHFGWSTYTEGAVAQHIRASGPPAGLMSEQERATLQEAVRALVAAAGPRDRADAQYLLMLAWQLGAFAHQRGLGPNPAAWIRHEVIDGLILTRTGLAGPSLLTYRSGLRRLRRGLTWITEGEKDAVRMRAPQPPREPYADHHLAAIRAWIRLLPTPYQRRCATAVICLGAGCGLTSFEIGNSKEQDLSVLPSGAVVARPPGSTRVIACRRQFEEDLATLAAHGTRWLYAPDREVDNPVNLITNIIDRMPRGQGIPRLDARRARSTWIVNLLRDRVPPDVVAEAAGMNSIEPLARYMRWLPQVDDDAKLRMLRGDL